MPKLTHLYLSLFLLAASLCISGFPAALSQSFSDLEQFYHDQWPRGSSNDRLLADGGSQLADLSSYQTNPGPYLFNFESRQMSSSQPATAQPTSEPIGERENIALDSAMPTSFFTIPVTARAYYLNDQRIEWSGVEATFGVEGILKPTLYRTTNWFNLRLESELFLQQPFDRNILADTPERRSYFANYDVRTFEISSLFLAFQRDPWTLFIGKFPTPFGRFYEINFSNSFLDAPFLRTESVLWRETGIMLRYKKSLLVIDAAITNGGREKDANSSKALISRVGLDGDFFTFGTSCKIQDGIGSENQKQFNNHIGADASISFGRWRIAGEVIYDEYGFRRPGFDSDNIFWEKSIYYRDLNKDLYVPLTSISYYASLIFGGERLYAVMSFGENYPTKIGFPQHDRVTQRGIAKVSYRIVENLDIFAVTIVENGGWVAQDGRLRKGFALLTGLQYSL